MTDWRIFFSNGGFHALIANSCILMVEKAFREAKQHSVISEETYQNIWDALSTNVNKDLSTVMRCFYQKYPLKFDPDNWGSVNSLGICRAIEKKLERSNDNKTIQRVRSLGWRIREVEPIFKVLREARNVTAHDFGCRDAAGRSTLVPAAVLRVTEICPLPENKDAPIDELLDECRKQICNAAQILLSGEKERVEAVAETAVKTEHSDVTIDGLTSQLDRIEKMLSEKPALKDVETDKNKQGCEDKTDPENTHPPEIHWLIPSMLKQELLRMKADCAAQFQDEVNLGPRCNLFQKALIADIMLYRPKDADEVIRLPDVGWRYQENILVLGRQFKYYREELNDILGRVDWD